MKANEYRSAPSQQRQRSARAVNEKFQSAPDNGNKRLMINYGNNKPLPDTPSPGSPVPLQDRASDPNRKIKTPMMDQYAIDSEKKRAYAEMEQRKP